MKMLTRITLGLFLMLAWTTNGISQTTHMVTNTLDSGTGSLRQAVINANDGDIIRLDTNLLNNGSDSIVLLSHIYFMKSLEFHGLYSTTDTLFISGGGTNRIFRTMSIAKLELDSMVLINGNDNYGGGIYFYDSDSLIIKNSTIRNNEGNDKGGGIYAVSSTTLVLILKNSRILHNTLAGTSSYSAGAGIFSWAKINGAECINIIENSEIRGNKPSAIGARGGGICCYGFETGFISIINSKILKNSAGRGGGVYCSGRDSSHVLISHSTISDNEAYTYSGGGVLCGANTSFSKAIVEVLNSTISNNVSHDDAGGVLCSGAGGTNVISSSSYVHVVQSTVTGNRAKEGAGLYSINQGNLGSSVVNVVNSTIYNNLGYSGFGGMGIASLCYYHASKFDSHVYVKGSIVGHNGSENIRNSNPQTIISYGYNLFSDTPFGSVQSDMKNISVNQLALGPLQNNGGTTETMVPDDYSVAINKGDVIDTTDAQNSAIIQNREVGAAEACILLGDEFVTACFEYTWIDGVTYVNSSNTNTYRIPNAQGCDSIVKLNLTINTVDTDVILDGFVLKAVNKNAISYQWLDCDNNYAVLIGDSLDTLIATQSGNYALEIMDQNCTDTSNCIAVTNVGVVEKYIESRVSIYPNPTTGTVQINLGEVLEQVELTLRDFQGRIISHQSFSNIQNIEYSINGASGIYFLQIINAEKQHAAIRIIKE